MPTLPGLNADVFFGFSDALPEWRSAHLQPLPPSEVAAILGKPIRRKRVPESPELLVRHAKRVRNPEVSDSFAFAASIPENMAPEMRADAWRQAARVAAGEAMEVDVGEEQRALDALARRAIRYAKRLGGCGVVGPAVYGAMEQPQQPQPPQTIVIKQAPNVVVVPESPAMGDIAKALQSMADKPEASPPVVNVSVPPANINVQAPIVRNTVKVPAQQRPVVRNTVNVAPAPVRVQSAKAPVVNTKVNVQPTPVRVRAPVVNNTVNVEPAPVRVQSAKAPIVNVRVPKQGPRHIVRDAKGNIIGSEPTDKL